MSHEPPTPVCKALLVCRQIFIDPLSGELQLLAPIARIVFTKFPGRMPLAIFAMWTNAHGSYRVLVQIRSLDGTVVAAIPMTEPFQLNDPLVVAPLTLRLADCRFSAPGKYELVLLANEQEVASFPLVVAQAVPPKPPR